MSRPLDDPAYEPFVRLIPPLERAGGGKKVVDYVWACKCHRRKEVPLEKGADTALKCPTHNRRFVIVRVSHPNERTPA